MSYFSKIFEDLLPRAIILIISCWALWTQGQIQIIHKQLIQIEHQLEELTKND